MSEKKFQVFISSTYEDLKIERQQIIRAILEFGDIPVEMEMFNGGDKEQWKTITRTIDNCDYYVLIIAQRYGSKKADKSYTQMEYEYAISKDIPILRFIINDKASWYYDKRDEKKADQKKLKDFKTLVGQNMVDFWDNSSDLESKFMKAYIRAKNNYPRPGWIKAINAPSIEMATEISRLSAENANMREEIKNINPLVGICGLSQENLIETLSKNKEWLRVRFDGNQDWEMIEEYSLWEIFNHLCIMNIDSSSNSRFIISCNLAYLLTPEGKIKGRSLCKTAPIPANIINNWLFKLESVRVVKNLLQDSLPTEKWIITNEGRSLYLFHLRRGMLTKAKI